MFPVLADFVAHRLLPEAVPAPSNPPCWDDQQLRPLLAQLEVHLQDNDFLAGAALTIADFSVAAMVTYFRAAGFPFAAFPGFAAWYARIEALEAWRVSATAPWE